MCTCESWYRLLGQEHNTEGVNIGEEVTSNWRLEKIAQGGASYFVLLARYGEDGHITKRIKKLEELGQGVPNPLSVRLCYAAHGHICISLHSAHTSS